MNRLQDKIIVVTGGSGLLGRAILEHVKGEGAIALNMDVNVPGNINSGTINCDITNENSVQVALEEIVQTYGRIDGWVNNAYPRTADWGNKFENISTNSWRENIDGQLNSLFICCKLVLAVMKNNNGSIVNIASVYGVVGPDFGVYDGTDMTMPAAYSAIKGGMINFTRYLASYYGPLGVRLNCVSPGGIFDSQNERFVKQYEQRVPMRRMGKPQEIAPSVSFLLSDEAAYITGHNLIVDGGWTSI